MNLQTVRRTFEPALRRVFHLYWRFARGMTLGVRGVVLDSENRVFLVKHTYVSGWQLPGGVVYDRSSKHYRDLLDNYYLPQHHFDACYTVDEIVAKGEERWVFH